MWIKTVIKETNELIEDRTNQGKVIYHFNFKDILSGDDKLISEKIFFDFKIDVEFKKDFDKNKILLLGEYNEKFWFFKIITKNKRNPFIFSIKKPLLEDIHDIRISIIDWDHVIKKFKPEKVLIEYAVSQNVQ